MAHRTSPIVRLWALSLVLVGGLSWAKELETTQIQAGDCLAGFSWKDGVTLSYRGLPIITRSTLSVHDPRSQTVYCHLSRVRPRLQVYSRGRDQFLEATYPPEPSNSEAQGLPFFFEYLLRLGPDNRAILSFRYEFRQSTPALLDYCIGRFLDTLWVGRDYQVETAAGTQSRQFPWLAPPPGSGSRAVAGNIRRLQVHTPLCDLSITVAPGSDLPTLYDSREQYVAAFSREAAVWLGVQRNLQNKQAGYCTVTLEFREREKDAANPTWRPTRDPALEFVPDAVLPVRGGLLWTGSGQPASPRLILADRPQTALPFHRSEAMPSAEALAAAVKLLYNQTLTIQQDAPRTQPRLIPAPQRLTWLDRDFVWDQATTVVVATDASAETVRCAEELIQDLADRYGQTLPLIRRDHWTDVPTGAIVVGTPRDILWAQPPKSMAGGPLRPSRPEGYVLEVLPERVLVCGYDEPGLFYGLQTLRQLGKIGEFDETAFTGVAIEDWPDFPFRGIHLLADNHALAWHKELIHSVFAPLKINTLVLECEYARWDSHPEIAPEWAMTKAEMRELRDYARAHFIEVIPLIQTLGHCGWMFYNGQHLDLAEDPELPYAYCVSNPATYTLVFDVLTEAIDLFQPKYLHIGHDEVHHRGRYPYCRSCRRYSPATLLVRDVEKLHSFLAERKVRTMMWGDLLLRPEEAPDAAHGGGPHDFARARDRLPRDLIICDWHYGTFDQYPSLSLFKSEGFDVIGACWYNPQNIARLSRAARKAQAWGLLQTTWTGYDGNRTAPLQHYDQLAAYIVAAEYAWSPGGPGLETLDYRPGEVLAHLTAPRREDRPRPGYLVDLQPYCTISLQARPGSGWIGPGREHDLSSLPTGVLRLGQVLFRIPRSASSEAGGALMLNGLYTRDRNLPESVVLPFPRSAQRLVFLHTCGWKTTAGRHVGDYEITYRDGSQERIELIYGYNITAWNDPTPTFRAHLAWEGRTRGGMALSLRTLTWDNPFPDRPLHHITFRSTGTETSPTLIALTAIE